MPEWLTKTTVNFLSFENSTVPFCAYSIKHYGFCQRHDSATKEWQEGYEIHNEEKFTAFLLSRS